MSLLARVSVFAAAARMKSANLLGAARGMIPRGVLPIESGSNLVTIGILSKPVEVPGTAPVEVIAVLVLMPSFLPIVVRNVFSKYTGLFQLIKEHAFDEGFLDTGRVDAR